MPGRADPMIGASAPPIAVRPVDSLRLVKLVHTLAWALFAGCIVAIPVAALGAEFGWAWALIAVVSVEVVVLACNRWSCPLTKVAARYTDDRGDNFDIWLPRWLARWNKQVFGTLYVAGVALTAALWLLRA